MENLLLYKLFNADCNHLLANGVVFEADPRPRTGYEYRYLCQASSEEFHLWSTGEQAAQIGEVPLAGYKLAQVWWAMRQAGASKLKTLPPDQRYCAFVQLQYPTISSAVVKGILDGLISAFQSHPYLPDAPRRISSSLGVDEHEVLRHLMDPGRAVLGAAAAITTNKTGGVQWNPDDTRLVAASIYYTRSSTRSVSARLYAAEQVKG